MDVSVDDHLVHVEFVLLPPRKNSFILINMEMYSQLSVQIGGSGSRLSLGGPTKVEAHKSFLFTEGLLKVENKLNLFV